MSDWLLTDEEIAGALTDFYATRGIGSVSPASILNSDRAIAKAQAKKLLRWLEGNHRQFSEDTQTGEIYPQGITLYEGQWQALKREVEV